MIQKLQDLVVKKIEQQQNDKHQSEKLKTIKKILEDDNCFFKMSLDTAISILYDLGFEKEEATKIYKELISSKYYNQKEV